jgi:hypothetical protein
MPAENFSGLSGKSPEEAAGAVGFVDRQNYFAHTIREIQRAIFLAHGRHYHVNTRIDHRVKETGIAYFQQGCDIYLTGECEAVDERIARLMLAHELGHLVRNIDRLELLSGFVWSAPEEEVYAWVFAYHLVLAKSAMHERDIERRKHIFGPGELKIFMAPLLREATPEVRRRVLDALGMPL